jgi:hypothetical protein
MDHLEYWGNWINRNHCRWRNPKLASARETGGAAAEASKAHVDRVGDPLPPGALRRLGTLRHRYLYRFWTHHQLSSDGKMVLTSTSGAVRWLDRTSGRLMDSWPLPIGQSVCGFSADWRLALLSDDKTLRLWDLLAARR